MRIAVTGAGGYVGGRLIERLRREPDVERIVGVDVRPVVAEDVRVVAQVMDVRDEGLEGLFREYGVDTVVHTAFVLFPPPRRLRWMEGVNVGGTANVVRAAERAGVRQVVFLSSATVYGAWPDNPVPLRESDPPRPNPDYPYAVHKLQAEEVVRSFGSGRDGAVWTILRPPGIVGPHLEGPLARLWRGPRSVIVDGGWAPAQLIHEDDLVDLLLAVVRARLGGVYNATPDDWVPWGELWPAAGKATINVPWGVGYPLFGLIWWLGLLGCATHPGQVRMARYPFVASNERARREAGWVPHYTTVEALRTFYQRR